MRHLIHQFNTEGSLSEWLEASSVSDSHKVLIQIFSGILEPQILSSVAQCIRKHLPDATIIGATTSGEIVMGKMYENSIVISMSVFENTHLKSIHVSDYDSRQMGCDIAKRIVDDETRCVIMFADGLSCNGEAILEGINQTVSRQIVVAGGMAGDNGIFSSTYCLHGQDVFQKGIVAVALSGPTLEVFHTYNLSWKPIGKKMVITKAQGNVIFEIDNQPIREVYTKYLGEEVASHMPSSTIEFPLIFQSNGINMARSMVALLNNGGIMYAGEITEGTEVRFGVGNPGLIRDGINTMYNHAGENLLEGMFVYSCSARKHLLHNDLEREFYPLAQLAPLAGFFTYGEFYRGSDENKFLNVTTTVLGLSEVKQKRESLPLVNQHTLEVSTTINALMHLVDVTIQENEQSKQRYQSIIQSEPECVKIVDERGRLLEMNAAGLGMLEAETLQDAQSIGLTDFLLPEGRGAFINLHKKVMSGEDGVLTFEVKGLKGTRRWLETHATPLRDEQGNVKALLGVTRDITEKIEADKRLQDSERFYRTIFASANEGIVILENNIIVDCNQLVSQIYERPQNEIIGQNILQMVEPSAYGEIHELLKSTLSETVAGTITCTITVGPEAQRRKVLEMRISAFGDEQHKQMVMIRDITKKLEDEQAFRMQARQAQMGEMISMIAHQWRQPLSVINTILSTILVQEHLKDSNDLKLIKQLEAMEQQTLHLSQTISDFRDFFRPDKPKEAVKISDIIDQAAKLLEKSFNTNAIKYQMTIQNDPKIVTYRNEVLQVIMTMFKNSIDAFSGSLVENRVVEVMLAQEDEELIISIRDNAGGIDASVIDKIFLPYFTTKHSSTGTGLGLYMSKMIIEEHCKGILEVKSQNNETTFTVKLKLDD